MKKVIVLIPVIALCGCAQYLLPSRSQLHEISQDTNSIHIQINSIYGTLQMDRNMDRFTAHGTNGGSVTLTPATTLKVTQ